MSERPDTSTSPPVIRAADAGSVDAAAARAAEVLAEGGVVVLPTETVYGVAALVSRPRAFEAMCRLCGGDPARPATVHVAGLEQGMRLLDGEDRALRRLLAKLLAAPITVVIEQPREQTAARLQAMGLDPALIDRIDDDGTVSLRCPSEPVARRVLELAPEPVVAVGAAAAGQPLPLEAQTAIDNVRGEVDLVIDAGRARHGKPSAIVRLSPGERTWYGRVVREGVLDRRILEKLLRCTVLLVCTGNTCRSPMAEALARRMLARSRGIEPDELEAAGFSVRSAGVSALGGGPATEQAVGAMAGLDLDLTAHRARPLTPQLIEEADLIYCMTRDHRASVLQMAPSAEDRTMTLRPEGDVPDPIGQDQAAYQHCAEVIEKALRQRFEEQQL